MIKRCYLALAYLMGGISLFADIPLFELTLKPEWHTLDTNPKTIEKFGGEWILAGVFDLKKRSPDPVKMNKLVLSWHGSHLDNLSASLYKKNSDHEFLPIQEYLICDSLWDVKNQKIIFNFDKNLVLEPRTVLYLVLTLPHTIEPLVQQGHFILESKTLPTLLQNSLPKKTFTLAYKH